MSLKETYGENSLYHAGVFEWYKWFSEGRESTEDDQYSGWPASVLTPQTLTKINEIVREDGSVSIQIIAVAVNTDYETIKIMLHDKLNMKKVCAKLVPKNLTPDQKLVCQQICSDFLEKLDEEPELIENIITCNEIWIFQYDVGTERQSMPWKTPSSPRMKKAKPC